MDHGCWEIKWSLHDDAVSALIVSTISLSLHHHFYFSCSSYFHRHFIEFLISQLLWCTNQTIIHSNNLYISRTRADFCILSALHHSALNSAISHLPLMHQCFHVQPFICTRCNLHPLDYLTAHVFSFSFFLLYFHWSNY